MFEQTKSGESAILVHINVVATSLQEDLQEFKELALSAGANPLTVITAVCKIPSPKYFIGSGKAIEIQKAVASTQAKLVIVNHDLTAAQERNLENLCQCRVIDRTGLILDIFAQRARTFEGKLQVEIAQLQHLSTRLVRGWTHLERQKGGIGLRGPGETQLETDRRLLRLRLKTLNKGLEKIVKQRNQSRRARIKAELPTVSLVGYTNAGKSTLFNLLTGEKTYVANQLFATLDPTLRRIELTGCDPFILADTVGFIRHLPHDLVAAFRATLLETQEAQLLLHVIDVSSESREDHIAQVNQVLEQIEANNIPQLEVYNKIDLISEAEPRIEYNIEGNPARVWISAAAGKGLSLLQQAITELLGKARIYREICLTPEQAHLRANLYDKGAVIRESIDEEGNFLLSIKISNADWERLTDLASAEK